MTTSTASSGLSWAPTTISASPSIRASCSREFAPFCVAWNARHLRRRRNGADRLPASLSTSARSVDTKGGMRVPLTSAEFDLLACFVERPRRVLSRDQLLDWTRGRSADPFDRTIDVTVSRLRKKLEVADPAAGDIVTTVRNGGYLFSAEVSDL
jgi:two-component system, OmpR family, response regulator